MDKTRHGAPRSALFARPAARCASPSLKPSASAKVYKVAKSAQRAKPPSSPSTATPPPLSTQAIIAPSPLPPTSVPSALPASPAITPFQHRVLSALLVIPAGKVTTYGALARAVRSAPRAIGGALRRNPWAPEVPCHRVIMENCYIGGFMGSIHAAPSGVNCERKLGLLAGEGVFFDERGFLRDRDQIWDEFDLAHVPGGEK